MSSHYSKLQEIQKFIEECVTQIFKVYGNELELKLEDYNLLANEKNCIESSTSIGFVIEEFVVAKMEKYTGSNNKNKQIVRDSGSTTTSSYDCRLPWMNINTLINIKAQKFRQANNGVAAIQKLYNDFVLTDPEQMKSYLVLKIVYSTGETSPDKTRKIIIKKVYSYFLDEINLFAGHHQDHRNWSDEYNPLSGRLQISNKDIREKRFNPEEISYKNTVNMLNAVTARSSKKQ